MKLEAKFHRLKDYFDKFDMALIKKKGVSVFNTTYGLYGSSSLFDVFELFQRIGLDKRKRFIDLGSGDGRVALLASLFTDAVGMEGDGELHALATEAKRDLLEHLPELQRCTLHRTDYMKENLSRHDIIFIYADHDWPAVFQEKLLKECKGVVLSQHNIYRPDKLKKGKTYWVEQTPFVSYPVNVSEEFLEFIDEE